MIVLYSYELLWLCFVFLACSCESDAEHNHILVETIICEDPIPFIQLVEVSILKSSLFGRAGCTPISTK
jgi:hypothetical protein